MKAIFVKNCDECPYCEVENIGEGHDVIAICTKYGITLIDPLEQEGIDIVTEIHPKCELKDFEL